MIRFTVCIFSSICLMTTFVAAQDLTKFEPDIVLECQNSKSNQVALGCNFGCFKLTDTAGPPGIGWLFERLEFYAREHHPSENWVVALKGRRTSPNSPVAIEYFTIGQANVCSYHPNGDHAVIMTKYYNETPRP